MKTTTKILCILIFLCTIISGCTYYAENTEQKEPEYIEFNNAEIPIDTTEIDLSGQNIEHIDTLTQLESLEMLDIRNNPIELDKIAEFKDKMPDCKVLFSIKIYDTNFDSDTAIIGFSAGENIEFDELNEKLFYFDGLKQVNLNSTQISKEDYDTLKKSYMDVEFNIQVNVCGIFFDENQYIVDLTECEDINQGELADALIYFNQLDQVKLGDALNDQEIDEQLLTDFPQTEFEWNAIICEQEHLSTVEELDVSGYFIEDLDAFKAELDSFYKLSYIDMCDCRLSNEQMEELIAEYPNIKFVWRIRVGAWEMRTDIKAFSTGHHLEFEGGRFVGGDYFLADWEVRNLKYCTDLEALDIGHQTKITDFSFLESLTKVKILIIAITKVKDLNLITHMKELEYLEIFNLYINDFSPLKELPNLKYLNASQNNITNVDDLLEMPQLEKLWLVFCHFLSDAEIERLKEGLPDCQIVTNAFGPTDGGWRGEDNEVYINMRETFGLEPVFSK